MLDIEHGVVCHKQRTSLLENRRTTDLAAVLHRRIGVDANAAAIASAVVTLWEDIDAALSLILGQRGVALLYKRSLYLTGQTHSWLVRMHEGAQTAMHLDVLKSGIAEQASADAAAAALIC